MVSIRRSVFAIAWLGSRVRMLCRSHALSVPTVHLPLCLKQAGNYSRIEGRSQKIAADKSAFTFSLSLASVHLNKVSLWGLIKLCLILSNRIVLTHLSKWFKISVRSCIFIGMGVFCFLKITELEFHFRFAGIKLKMHICDCFFFVCFFSDDDFDMSRYSSSGYSSAEVRCLRIWVLMYSNVFSNLRIKKVI